MTIRRADALWLLGEMRSIVRQEIRAALAEMMPATTDDPDVFTRRHLDLEDPDLSPGRRWARELIAKARAKSARGSSGPKSKKP